MPHPPPAPPSPLALRRRIAAAPGVSIIAMTGFSHRAVAPLRPPFAAELGAPQSRLA